MSPAALVLVLLSPFAAVPSSPTLSAGAQSRTVAGEKPAISEMRQKEIAELVEQLGSGSYDERQQAQQRLIEIGDAALPALEQAVAGKDLEVRSRASALLERIRSSAVRERARRFASRIREVEELSESLRAAWTPDGKQFALLRWEQPIEFFDRATLQPIAGKRLGKRQIHFDLGPRDGMAAWIDQTRITIALPDSPNPILIRPGNAQPTPVFNPDGTLIASGGYGRSAGLWDVRTGRRVATLEMGPKEGGLTPAFSPDGKILAVGNRNYQTRLFDGQTGKLLRTLDAGRRSSHGLSFSPNGKLLAIGYVDGQVGLWNPDDGSLIELLDGNADEVIAVTWDPGGKLLVWGGTKGPITFWSIDDRRAIAIVDAPEYVLCLAFSPDGKLLVSCGKTTQVWSVPIDVFQDKSGRTSADAPVAAPRPDAGSN